MTMKIQLLNPSTEKTAIVKVLDGLPGGGQTLASKHELPPGGELEVEIHFGRELRVYEREEVATATKPDAETKSEATAPG